jgi:hypothetical protein
VSKCQKRKPPGFLRPGAPNPTFRSLEFLRSFEFQAKITNVSRWLEFPLTTLFSQKCLAGDITRRLTSKSASFHTRVKINTSITQWPAILQARPSAPCRALPQTKAPAIATRLRVGPRATALAERSSHREIPERHDKRAVWPC